MKKNTLLIIVIATLLSITLCACGSGKTSDGANTSAEATSASAPDPTKLIVGTWNNKNAGVITKFKADGTFTTVQNGETILASTYTVEKVDNSTINVTTGKGQTIKIVFVDEDTIKSDDATSVRITEASGNAESDNSASASASLSTLIIGKWISGNGSIEFASNGKVFSTDDSGNKVSYPYDVKPIDDTSVNVTLKDSDGTTRSETAVFKDNNTMILGDTTFKRANGASANNANTSDSSANAVQKTNTFSDPAYSVTFKYPASMRIDKMDNNTVQLTSKINNAYQIRYTQKFLQDSLNKGLTYEGATKDFIKIYIDGLKNNAKDVISNYTDSSETESDGSAYTEAIFNAQTSSGYWKVRTQAFAMDNCIVVATVWSHDEIFDDALKEMQSIMDTLTIKK